MKKLVLLVMMVGMVAASGCGGGSDMVKSAPVSVWAVPYTGTWASCGESTPNCKSDVISFRISQATSTTNPQSFSSSITISGNDATTGKAFSGSGTSAYAGTAPIGPGTFTTTATLQTTLGNWLIIGNGKSTQAAPMGVTSGYIYSYTMVNGSAVKGLLLGNFSMN